MDYDNVKDWLFSRRRMGMKYGLERILNLMADLGDPQRSFRTVHVVGTNGKGSTTAILAEIARHLGFRTGRMTSPHLLDFRERIALNGVWIPCAAVTSFIEDYRGLLEKHEATFFEIITALAAWYFEQENVDWVIAEAGLGGRLDASRIFAGEGTILTGVQIEHSRILGKTRPLIAAEKVAIADRGTLIVAALQTVDVESIIAKAIAEKSLRRVFPGEVSRAGLPGEHQKRNAALAVTAALELFDRTVVEIEQAFEKTCKTIQWPGRLDLRPGKPSILFDVAHNPEAVEQLLEHISDWAKPVPAVVGFLADKPWQIMSGLLRPHIGPVVTTTPLSERKLDAAELAEQFDSAGMECHVRENISEAVALCRSLSGSSTMLVTGSFFLVGEAMLTAWTEGWIEEPEGETSQALLG
jgi:dihydrofolate synthase/folylpolyglutamate synthase